MSASLHHTVIAHFESRRRVELDSLIRRHGGVPWAAPAVSEVPLAIGALECETIDRLADGSFDVIVLITGAGTRYLFDAATRASRLPEVLAALTRATVVARGPKPVFALRQQRLRPTTVAAEPNTTAELLHTLDAIPVDGRRVLVLSAGEPFEEPTASLRSRGADVVELQLYRWALAASDANRLTETTDALVAGSIQAALFTTQVQVRHLMAVAEQRGQAASLLSALREHVVVGAVGPTCANALRERGVEPDVVPEHPRMGQLVIALAEQMSPSRQSVPIDVSEQALDYVHAILSGAGGYR